MPRLQARSRQRLRLFALGTWSNVPSPVPIWRANERARESVSPRERERESGRESGLVRAKATRTPVTLSTPATYESVCRPHTSCTPPYRYCIPNTSRCLPPPPLGKERPTLRTARPPIAQGSSLRDPLSHATTTRREANRCTIIALLSIPRPPAVTRLDVLTAHDHSRCILESTCPLGASTTFIRKEEPLARLNHHLADLPH